MSQSKAIYGIVGNPLAHSLSPLMHNVAFKALGVAAEYKLYALEENELDPFFEDLHGNDCPIFGLNVTVPYKEKAMDYLDNYSPLVEKIHAVNTIVITQQRKLIGYNTDAPGFLAHLKELKFNIKGKRVSILGAGGSARGIITALCLIPDHPESIKIYNRTRERARDLIADLAERVDTSIIECVKSVDALDIELADLLINTTSIVFTQWTRWVRLCTVYPQVNCMRC